MVMEWSHWRKTAEKISPYVYIVLAQVIAATYAVMSKLVFTGGTDPVVFNVYQFIAASLFMGPLAFFFERKSRPPLTLSITCWIFFQALLGATLFQTLFSESLDYISSTAQSAIINLFPAFTYVLSVILRQERAELNRVRGVGKLLGTVVSVSGALTLILWKNGSVSAMVVSSLGSVNIGYAIATFGVLSLSTWLVLQGPVMARYPAELSIVAMMYMFATLQTAAIAAFTSHEPSKWKLNLDLELINILFGGVLNSGIGIYIFSWCAGKKGPLFTAVFAPLNLLLTAVMEMAIVGDKLSVGSLVGSVMIVGGLYLFLWSKSKEETPQDMEDDLVSPFLLENP
ncbi:hypothetical protein Scep_010994 [Stephania cephalantha]|uniref:WAT1-related protein n=1 Tax=Stephania cephalantha TaxID=152367 RepID=A0AAP0JW72_9MAGN